jgi:hypothetical protein
MQSILEELFTLLTGRQTVEMTNDNETLSQVCLN